MGADNRDEHQLKRDISRTGFAAISLNGVIGAGIFGLPAVAAAKLGAFSPWMILICGVLIFTVVLSFAWASSLVRRTGGMIVYASDAFGLFAGFQTGWLGYVSRAAAMGANTNLLVTYAAWFWAPLDANPYRGIALAVLIGSLTWLNMRGVRHGMAAIYVFTVLKLLPLSLLILFGLGHIDLQMLFGAELPGMDGLGGTILVLLYAYVGFEGTVVTAGEGRNPRRDLPRALVHTILGIAVIYFLVQIVSLSVMPNLAESKTALADVAQLLLGSLGATVLTLGAVFSIAGNLNSSILSAPRMTYALSRDGSLPPWFGKVHHRFRTPHNSVLFYGVLCLALALTGSFIWLAIMSTLVRLLTYMICIVALPRLSRSGGGHENEFRLPGKWLIPVIALLLCAWLITHASLAAWGLTAGFVLMGSLLFGWSKWSAAKAGSGQA
jgi:amino acid transporter